MSSHHSAISSSPPRFRSSASGSRLRSRCSTFHRMTLYGARRNVRERWGDKPTMRIVHRRDGTERTITQHGDRIDSFGSRVRGLVRLALRDDCALVFDFDSVADRRASTLMTPLSLDIVWTKRGQVTRVVRLNPWTGVACGKGDGVFEFPVGPGKDIKPGDELVVR